MQLPGEPCELDPHVVIDTIACSGAIGAVLGFIIGVALTCALFRHIVRSKHGEQFALLVSAAAHRATMKRNEPTVVQRSTSETRTDVH